MSAPSSAEPITSPSQLSAVFTSAARPAAGWLVGLEQEKIAVLADGSPIPYEGPSGVTALLAGLSSTGFVPVKDGTSVIGAIRGRE